MQYEPLVGVLHMVNYLYIPGLKSLSQAITLLTKDGVNVHYSAYKMCVTRQFENVPDNKSKYALLRIEPTLPGLHGMWIVPEQYQEIAQEFPIVFLYQTNLPVIINKCKCILLIFQRYPGS